jgi:polyisoprenoid-binding protein YceI
MAAASSPVGDPAPPAWAQDWKVDYGKSEIRFVIKQMNVPVEGGFKRFNVQAKFDAAKPSRGNSGWMSTCPASIPGPRKATAR